VSGAGLGRGVSTGRFADGMPHLQEETQVIYQYQDPFLICFCRAEQCDTRRKKEARNDLRGRTATS
jgi:hypothetical protein